MGFEPTHGGTTNLCLNPLATLAILLLALIILTQAWGFFEGSEANFAGLTEFP